MYIFSVSVFKKSTFSGVYNVMRFYLADRNLSKKCGCLLHFVLGYIFMRGQGMFEDKHLLPAEHKRAQSAC